jgi:putative methyltransferase (TIGR04325 family)
MASTKDVLRSLTPPILWQTAHRLKSHFAGPNFAVLKSVFEGPLPSWEAAMSRSDGWDSPLITDKTLDAARKVRDGLIEFEQDGLARKKIIYSATILAFLLLVLSRHQNVLNIIDFGGGLGSNYVQNRKILRQLTATAVRWNVVERATFAKLGIEQFQTSELNFFSTLEAALSNQTPIPALLFSGSLQYIIDPLSLLDRVVNAGIEIIAFDRLLVGPGEKHAVFIQHPDQNVFYKATYPVWCFSKDAFVAWLVSKGFILVEDFTSNPEGHFDHCGLIFIRKI